MRRIDAGRAAFAVVLALILYLVAVSETNPESTRLTDFQVPMDLVNVPAGLVTTDRPPPMRVRVRAPQNVFNRLRPESFTAQVDASSARPGDNNLPALVRSSDTEVRDVQPEQASVRLRVEEVQERLLPVRVNLLGQVPPGYQVGQPRSEPQRVTVAGASSLVSRASEAVVDVSVERVTVTVNGVYTPRVVDERGNDLRDLNLRITPASVTVEVPITQQTQYKEVGIRPVTQGSPAPGYILLPLEVNPPTTTIVGDPAALESASYVETQPININGVSTTVVRAVGLVPPPGTLLLQQGQQVTVTVRVTPLTIAQTVRVPVSVINLPQSMVLVRQPDPVAVTISGPAPTLSSLNARDFRVVLDLSGRGPGRHEVEPLIQNLPSEMTLESFDPRRVVVDLQDAPTPTPTAVPTSTPTPTPTPAPPAA